MKSFKILMALAFALPFTSSLAMNIPADSWCGYTEFPMAKNAGLKDQIGVIRVRALQCSGEPGGVTVPSIKDPSKTCTVENSKISANLVKIADKTCNSNQTICMAAYNSLRVYNPVDLKNNAAYTAIFECP